MSAKEGTGMKIRIALTIEVDPQEWASVYGTDTDARSVRQDVQEWAKHTLLGHPDGLVDLPEEKGQG